MTQTAFDPSRAVIGLRGEGIATFLQGLVSNDMLHLSPGQAAYAALLTPQGKLLADFLVMPQGPEDWLVDVVSARAPALMQRLQMYRLRRAIEIVLRPDLGIELGWGADSPPPSAVMDPRDAALGWRRVINRPADAVPDTVLAEYHLNRLRHAVPGDASLSDEGYILELGFERLNGVDFRKGCYVGQEVTARMKHKTDLRRRLVPVTVNPVIVNDVVITPAEVTQDGRGIGTLTECIGTSGLALLRLDKIEGNAPLLAGGAALRLA